MNDNKWRAQRLPHEPHAIARMLSTRFICKDITPILPEQDGNVELDYWQIFIQVGLTYITVCRQRGTEMLFSTKTITTLGELLDEINRMIADKGREDYINYVEHMGYVEMPQGSFNTTKELGMSELCMFTGTVTRKPKRVWVNKQRTYAFVIMDDDKWLHGCFNQHADGSIGLS